MTTQENPKFDPLMFGEMVRALYRELQAVRKQRMEIRKGNEGSFVDIFLRVVSNRLVTQEHQVFPGSVVLKTFHALVDCAQAYNQVGQDQYNKWATHRTWPSAFAQKRRIVIVALGTEHWEPVLEAYWVVTLAELPEDARNYFDHLARVGAQVEVKDRPFYEIVVQAWKEYCVAFART